MKRPVFRKHSPTRSTNPKKAHTMKPRIHHIAATLALALGAPLNAQNIYDGFATGTAAGQYPPGDNASVAVGGGTNWSQPSWVDSAPRKFLAVANGLTYSDGKNELATTKGAIQSPNADGNGELERDFQAFGAGNEVWFSILMDRTPAAHGFEDRFAFQLRSQTGGLKYSIRALDGSKEWHASYIPQGSNSEVNAALPSAAYDEPTFFVGRISAIGSPSATFSVWVNPKDLTDLGEPTWTSPAFHAQGFGRVSLVTDGTREGFFDEIRIGLSSEEVVPLKSAAQ